MNKIMLAIVLTTSIWLIGTSDIKAQCPIQQQGLLKPGDWIWINPYGWCRVVSVGEPTTVIPQPDLGKPKAPKLDDKSKLPVKPQPKGKENEKVKGKAPKFDDK